MRNTFASLLALVALLVVFTFVSPAVKAQSIADNVTVSVGVADDSGAVATGFFEVQKVLSPKLMLDNTLLFSDVRGKGTGQNIANTTLLRGYIGKNFFLAGGGTLGKLVNTGIETDLYLNPTVQAGVTFDAGSRVQFEPYVQLDTPDLLSSNPARSLGVNLTTKIRANGSFGFVFDVGITQTRANNDFLQDGGVNRPSASGGLYFNF